MRGERGDGGDRGGHLGASFAEVAKDKFLYYGDGDDDTDARM